MHLISSAVEYSGFDWIYLEVSKFSHARKHCCNQFKIHIKRSNYRVICPIESYGIANSAHSDQTAPIGLLEEQSDLGLHCLPRPICRKN